MATALAIDGCHFKGYSGSALRTVVITVVGVPAVRLNSRSSVQSRYGDWIMICQAPLDMTAYGMSLYYGLSIHDPTGIAARGSIGFTIPC